VRGLARAIGARDRRTVVDPVHAHTPAGSYGSLARYTELRRIRRVGDFTLLAASGEYSDFQYLMDVLGELVLSEDVLDDNAKLTAEEVHSYVTRVMYQRRNKMNPLWNTVLVAGFKDGKS
jgi:20S proteasome subunit beta 7